MPWAGYPRDIAPRLTELEKASVSFAHAYSISSFTSKSVGGLLGGEYPSAMTRDGVFFTRYFDDNLMFPERLRAGGIRTLSLYCHMYLDRGRGFEQGFDDYRMIEGITFDYNKDPYVTSQKLAPARHSHAFGGGRLTVLRVVPLHWSARRLPAAP